MVLTVFSPQTDTIASVQPCAHPDEQRSMSTVRLVHTVWFICRCAITIFPGSCQPALPSIWNSGTAKIQEKTHPVSLSYGAWELARQYRKSYAIWAVQQPWHYLTRLGSLCVGKGEAEPGLQTCELILWGGTVSASSGPAAPVPKHPSHGASSSLCCSHRLERSYSYA